MYCVCCRYDVALAINTYGAKYVLDFAKKCINIKLFLHVSTGQQSSSILSYDFSEKLFGIIVDDSQIDAYSAYVSGEKPGLILETPFSLGETLNGEIGLDIEQEKRIMEDTLNMLKSDNTSTDKAITLAMKDLGMRR